MFNNIKFNSVVEFIYKLLRFILIDTNKKK